LSIHFEEIKISFKAHTIRMFSVHIYYLYISSISRHTHTYICI